MVLKHIKIQFCFPEYTGKDQKTFVLALMRHIQSDKKIGYAGFARKKDLKKYLASTFSHSNIQSYTPLTAQKKHQVERIIRATLHTCIHALPPLSAPLQIFVFPFLEPFDVYDKKMGYIYGYCPYKDTIHIYLSPQNFSRQHLQYSIAHEYSHAVYFSYHPGEQTVAETIIFEGLAENFEEIITGKGPAPYATVLTKNTSVSIFRSIKNIDLNTKNRRLYKYLFFGGERYKKWTGYAIGYWIIKSFRTALPRISWQAMMQKNTKEILERSGFLK